MIKRIFRRKTTKTDLKKATTEDMNELGAAKILKDATDIGESSANGDGISTDQYDEGSTKQN